MKAVMSKIANILRRLWLRDPWREYVDAGVIDFSGQGRDKYGH